MRYRSKVPGTAPDTAAPEDHRTRLLGHPELRLVDRLHVKGPARVRVVGTTGCAWGYALGAVWEVDAAGQVTPRLCRVAGAPLEDPALLEGETGARVFTCSCPIPGNSVTFQVL